MIVCKLVQQIFLLVLCAVLKFCGIQDNVRIWLLIYLDSVMEGVAAK